MSADSVDGRPVAATEAGHSGGEARRAHQFAGPDQPAGRRHAEHGADKEFGVYLPREEISAELAQTCEELRRFVDERGQARQASLCRRRLSASA